MSIPVAETEIMCESGHVGSRHPISSVAQRGLYPISRFCAKLRRHGNRTHFDWDVRLIHIHPRQTPFFLFWVTAANMTNNSHNSGSLIANEHGVGQNYVRQTYFSGLSHQWERPQFFFSNWQTNPVTFLPRARFFETLPKLLTGFKAIFAAIGFIAIAKSFKTKANVAVAQNIPCAILVFFSFA